MYFSAHTMSAWDLSMFGKLVDAGPLSPQMESSSIGASRSASTSSSSLAIGSVPSAQLGRPSSVAAEVSSSRASSFARLDLGDRKSGSDLPFAMDDVASTAQRAPPARRPLSGASSLPSRFLGSSPPMAIPSSLARRAFADDRDATPRDMYSAWDAKRRRASGAPYGIASSARPASALDSLDDPWGTQQESFSTRMAAMRLREAEKVRVVAQEEERVRVLAHKKDLARKKRLSALGLMGDGGRAASGSLRNSLSRPRPIAAGIPASLLPMNQRVAPNESGGGASSVSNGSEGSSPIKGGRRPLAEGRSDGGSEEQPRDAAQALRRSSMDSEGVESVNNAFRSSREASGEDRGGETTHGVGAKRGSVFSDVDKDEEQLESASTSPRVLSPTNLGSLGAALRRDAPGAGASSAKVSAAGDRFASHSHSLSQGLLAGFDGEAALISDNALFGVTDDALGFAGDVGDELCFDLEL